MDNRAAMMMRQFKKATVTDNEFVKFAIDPKDCNTWYLLLRGFSGDDDEFVGGEYLVRMFAPPKFPFEPPQFYFLTENGVYAPEVKVCINIGEYHKDDYRATLGMSGFADELVNGMIGWRSLKGGINLINTTIAQKRSLAQSSRAVNKIKFPHIMDMINESYEFYSKSFKSLAEVAIGAPQPSSSTSSSSSSAGPSTSSSSAPTSSHPARALSRLAGGAGVRRPAPRAREPAPGAPINSVEVVDGTRMSADATQENNGPVSGQPLPTPVTE